MQIRMIQTAHGSTNGANRVEYEKGKVYETRIGRDGDDMTTIPESLAANFIKDGVAEEVHSATRASTTEIKVEKQPGKPGPKEVK